MERYGLVEMLEVGLPCYYSSQLGYGYYGVPIFDSFFHLGDITFITGGGDYKIRGGSQNFTTIFRGGHKIIFFLDLDPQIIIGCPLTGSAHTWKRSGITINAAMWSGGVIDTNYSPNNAKRLNFGGSSPASPHGRLLSQTKLSSIPVLCEEFLCE